MIVRPMNIKQSKFGLLKKMLSLLFIFGFLGLIFIFTVYLKVIFTAKPLTRDITAVPKAQVALVLGAKVQPDGTPSDMLKDRAEMAVELYKSGKVEKIIASGDHGTKGYDEVNAMKKYLLDRGVKPEDLFLDHAGFDTFDSIYRAGYIFEAKSMIIPTQDFHLPRALYIAKSLKYEVTGVRADKRNYGKTQYNYLREVPADVKSFFRVAFHTTSKYLGPKIPITGDSQKSWD